ncbi:MAG TPA: bifunctional glutamate N-acetyltransferase/amino-acid acetyltransferase ArgJ [Dehalococcoidia bacterium]|nr:bifunctional glutamate N-acetyltransferase/amino-acid acetyltransferase ArgJ [Dehalococcoidia bacterium]
MAAEIEGIEGGGVTSPAGWRAGATYAGIKTYGEEPRFDIGILASEAACTVAGVFTQNAITGPSVTLTRERTSNGVAQALVTNSGISNTATGEQGMRDALRMTELAAQQAGVEAELVLVGSTGVIGWPLPMDLVESGIPSIELSAEGGTEFSRAIMTTDTVAKHRAVRVTVDGRSYTVGGTAKGSGMIHPDMATCFCFLTTDAPVDLDWLRGTLKAVADVSINMVDIDMDTSTSDTMLLFANGLAGGEAIDAAHPAAEALHEALEAVAIALARDLARDGEGAQTLIEVVVEGAATVDDARLVARTVSSSLLVKTMITGRDPNWGRLLMAIGRSGAEVVEQTITITIAGERTFQDGAPTDADLVQLATAMDSDEVQLRIDLGRGDGAATAWGCDLTTEYVHINADYTT